MDYIRRDILDSILSRIKQDRVIVITGARQTGKTTRQGNYGYLFNTSPPFARYNNRFSCKVSRFP